MRPKHPQPGRPTEVASSVVKVRPDTLERARALAARVALHGWGIVGANRGEAPTFGAVLDEGLRALEARVSAPGKEKLRG